MRRIVTALVATALLGGAAAAPAVAAETEKLYAPNAQAAAVVKIDPDTKAYYLAKAKNIESFERVSAGKYCLKVDDNIALDTTVATINSYSSASRVFTEPTATCKNAPQTLTVETHNSTAYVDSWFQVAVL